MVPEIGIDELKAVSTATVAPVEPAVLNSSASNSAKSAAPDQAISARSTSSIQPPVSLSLSDETVKRISEDSATLSLTGQLISMASESSSVRFARVAELRSAIESGSYNVASVAVAEALIRNMSNL